MVDDIVNRLRDRVKFNTAVSPYKLMEEAADEITDLRKRVAELEAALKPFATIAQVENSIGTKTGASVIVNVERCRDALAALIPSEQKGDANGK